MVGTSGVDSVFIRDDLKDTSYFRKSKQSVVGIARLFQMENYVVIVKKSNTIQKLSYLIT